jgi:hypothetical protein
MRASPFSLTPGADSAIIASLIVTSRPAPPDREPVSILRLWTFAQALFDDAERTHAWERPDVPVECYLAQRVEQACRCLNDDEAEDLRRLLVAQLLMLSQKLP